MGIGKAGVPQGHFEPSCTCVGVCMDGKVVAINVSIVDLSIVQFFFISVVKYFVLSMHARSVGYPYCFLLFRYIYVLGSSSCMFFISALFLYFF